MNKQLLLIGLVGLFGFFVMPNLAKADTVIDVSYCNNSIEDNTIYRLTNDVYFNNASLYNWQCFDVGIKKNVTINLMGYTIYPNYTNTATGITGSGANANLHILNGTINFTFHGVTSSNCISFGGWGSSDIWIEDINCVGAGGIGYIGLTFATDDQTNLTVRNSNFTEFNHNDLELHPAQSQILGCGNNYTTFWSGGSVLSKDPCYYPPADYKDYYVEVNCTRYSSGASASLSCSNSIEIPMDCRNITTRAWTRIILQNYTYPDVVDPNLAGLNDSYSFSRYTCNPEDNRVTYCDHYYQTCTLPHIFEMPEREYNAYAQGQNATSYHIVVTPFGNNIGCLNNPYANVTMIGRLAMTCKSYTQSGIHIDEVEYSCEHTVRCFNSNTMEERFIDCTSILTPCDYGCVEGVCRPATQEEEQSETMLGDDIAKTYPAVAWVTLLISPVSLVTMFLIGIGSVMEYQARSKGAIFLAVVVVGALAFSYLGIYPAWLGILIAIVCGALLTKYILKLW